MSSVMVVEDNDDLRILYEKAIRLGGHRVISASNGAEALDLLERTPERPCVILLDLMMPVMDGWEFLQEKSKDDRVADIPVVVCSAAKENVPDCTEFFRKPVDLKTLLRIAQDYGATATAKSEA